MDKSFGKKQKLSITCEDGGKEVDLTLNERFQGQAQCASCGTRFPLVGVKTLNLRTTMVIPKHNVPAELHELRKKMEKNAHEAKSRNNGDVKSSGEPNLSTRP